MRTLPIWFSTIILFLLMSVVACTQLGRITTPAAESATPQQKAVAETQEVIAQATRGLLNAQKLMLDEIGSGVFTEPELRATQAKLKQILDGLAKANAALRDCQGGVAQPPATDAKAESTRLTALDLVCATAFSNASSTSALASGLEALLERDLAQRRKK